MSSGTIYTDYKSFFNYRSIFGNTTHLFLDSTYIGTGVDLFCLNLHLREFLEDFDGITLELNELGVIFIKDGQDDLYSGQ